MTSDARKGLQLQYNFLNLLEKAEATIPSNDPNDPNAPATTESASYTWLADGTKAQVLDENGEGYVYLGSLIYKRLPDGTLELESTNHGSGRIVVKKDANGETVLDANGNPVYEPQYHITDHLGSVRVVINQDGEVLARNDYYPFGKQHDNPALMSGLTNPATPEANRFLFNGKEKQLTGGLNLLDYGWRMHDPELGRWHTVDPLANVYYSQSPYSYCYNKPLYYIDPDGRFIVSGHDTWKRQREKVENKITDITSQMIQGDFKSFAHNLISKGKSLSSLMGTLSTMDRMESDAGQGFKIGRSYSGEGELSYNGKTGVIGLYFSDTPNFVHEVEHVGQFFNGGFGYATKSNGTTISIALDIFDEVGAYQAQYAYDPSSVSGLAPKSPINSSNDITSTWVQGLQAQDGSTPYAIGGKNGVSPIPLNIHSTKADMLRAFPSLTPDLQSYSNTTPLYDIYNNLHYYKK